VKWFSVTSGISKGAVIAIIVVAVLAFAAGFVSRPPVSPQTVTIPSIQTIAVREIMTVTSTYTTAQIVIRETTSIVTRTQIATVTTAVERTITSQITATVPTTIQRTIISTITQQSTITVGQTIPAGATPLPFSGKTAFALISTGLNFNGSSRGGIGIYIPAGWGLDVTFTNSHIIPHNIAIVRNSTTAPQSRDIGSDGTIIASQPPTYTSGIPSGATVTLSVHSLSEGIYWIACGVPGHASAGMWIILVVSPNVSTPYVIQLQQPGGTEYPYSYGIVLVTLTAAMIPMIFWMGKKPNRLKVFFHRYP
jgi:sulfocyanin